MRDGNLAFNLNDLNSPGGLALAAGLLALCGIRGQGDREAMERVEKAEEARRREEMARKKAEDKAEEEMKARMQAETKAEEEARAREMADALAAVALAERAETEEKLKMEQRLREL